MTTRPLDLTQRPASPIVPRGLSRTEAAAYVGVGTTLFDEMVADGRMPGPKLINSRTVWDRLQLDTAFSALPDRETASTANPWDAALARKVASG